MGDLARHPCHSLYPDSLEVLDDAAKAKPWVVVDCPPGKAGRHAPPWLTPRWFWSQSQLDSRSTGGLAE